MKNLLRLYAQARPIIFSIFLFPTGSRGSEKGAVVVEPRRLVKRPTGAALLALPRAVFPM